jgi:surfeit locus 1 family protein
MTRTTRLLSAAIAAAAAILLLCGLGIWQLERLHWKEQLIADIAARQVAAPLAYDGGAVAAEREFTRATVDGQYLPEHTLFMMATYEGGPGWQAITPFALPGGVLLLVDRGTLGDKDREAVIAATPRGPLALTGLLRRHDEPRPGFAPDNDPAGNRWYWWDLPAMQLAVQQPASRPAAAVLQLLPDGETATVPRAAAPTANLRNNHLSYAITWFSLALALAAMTALFFRGQMRKTGA